MIKSSRLSHYIGRYVTWWKHKYIGNIVTWYLSSICYSLCLYFNSLLFIYRFLPPSEIDYTKCISALNNIDIKVNTLLLNPTHNKPNYHKWPLTDLWLMVWIFERLKKAKLDKQQMMLLSLRSNPQTRSPYIQKSDGLCTRTDHHMLLPIVLHMVVPLCYE